MSLFMTHRHGVDAESIHSFAWDVFQHTTEVARSLGLYGAGQDLLSDAFSGNLRGMGPGYAECEFTERASEPVICFLADKTEPGAWNFPLYKMFADPFNTAGLVIDAKMHAGFRFEVYDLYDNNRVWFDCPADLYDLLMFIAGKYVGKDDPVVIVRCQSGLPAVGEVLEPFAFPYTVAGCMRGSHHADPSFDEARRQANTTMDYLRRHGPFEPHRLPLSELEYTTMPELEKRTASRWEPITAKRQDQG